MESTSDQSIATIIGEAVIILLQSGRRVTVGNILDVLEHKRHSKWGGDSENLREAISFIRSKSS